MYKTDFERWGEANKEIDRLNDELEQARADNAILESAIMGAETIQPNGEIGTSVTDLVRELDRASEGERVAMAQLSNAQKRITDLNSVLGYTKADMERKGEKLIEVNDVLMRMLDRVEDEFIVNRIFEASNIIYSTLHDDENNGKYETAPSITR